MSWVQEGVWSPPHSPEAFRIKGALWNAELNKNANFNSQVEESQRKSPKWTSQTGKDPYKNHSEKHRALQNAKKNNKTTMDTDTNVCMV